MQITQEFEVARPMAAVWEMFQDVPAVAQCLPGAELTEDKGNGVYGGKISVKMGPIAATFEGEANVSPDPSAHTALIEGKGVDKRGGSRGQVKVNYALTTGEAGKTKVSIDADVTLAGPAAQFGRTGLINEMSSRLITDFANCLEAKLSATTEEEAESIKAGEVKGISLFLQSFWAWIKRLFGGK
ncbi:MAG TPA: SRPBCC family protein [Acidimicrobiia bacterium]|nr:SRPBCC family protein [Acidimicrobiia bacterium]